MLPRERVLTALEHKEPDRVPITIGGSAGKFYYSTAYKLADHLGIARDTFEKKPAGFKYIPYSEELWECLGVDIRYLYPNHHQGDLLKAQEERGDYVNKWGSKFSYVDTDAERPNLEMDVPLADADLDDLKNYSWPEPDHKLVSGLREKAEELKAEGKYAIAVYRPLSAGIFGTSRYFLRGTELFLQDLLINKKFANYLLDRVLEVQKMYYGMILDEIGDLIDIIEIEDDLGMQDRPLISPDLYRTMIKPRHMKLVNFIKTKGPEVKVLMHSDGAIRDLISDIIEVGVDILNPIQPGAAGMDLNELNKEFGTEISFAGAVDVQQALEGSIDDVKECIEETIDALAPGGGFLLGTSHNFSTTIPIENIITMINTAKQYGTY